jgi:AraC-like DNA-binding protein
MEILYPEEHFSCQLYGRSKVEKLKIPKGKQFPLQGDGVVLVYIEQGSVVCFQKEHVQQILKEGSLSLFLLSHKPIFQANSSTSFFLMRINSEINFCEFYSIESLYKLMLAKQHTADICSLQANKRIILFFDLLAETYQDGLKCENFFIIKQKELLYYLRAYYSKQDLFNFFSPVYSIDFIFSRKVRNHVHELHTVADIAALTHCSISGVQKRFSKVFGKPPLQWIREEKAKRILYELNCTNKPIKQIAHEFRFSSTAHFYTFCKSQFSMTPGVIRKVKYNNEK